jgi:p-aminobenzoyl-glutamate transporter AbgT
LTTTRDPSAGFCTPTLKGFAPLGAILALVLGAGFAERVGLLPALMVKMASHRPQRRETAEVFNHVR